MVNSSCLERLTFLIFKYSSKLRSTDHVFDVRNFKAKLQFIFERFFKLMKKTIFGPQEKKNKQQLSQKFAKICSKNHNFKPFTLKTVRLSKKILLYCTVREHKNIFSFLD